MSKHIRARNEGSISKRPSGHWRAQTTPVNGHRISRTFITKIEAINWLRQRQAELDRGFDYQGSKTLLKDYLSAWLDSARIGLRPRTVESYEKTLKNHVIPYLGDIPLKDLTHHQVEKFYTRLIEAGVGVRSVRLVHSIFHRALEVAVYNQLLIRNPSAHATLPRYIEAEMKVLDEVQVNRFLVAAIDHPYLALYHLAVKTGMREGELFGLKWIDLQWESGRLSIQRQLQHLHGKGYCFQEPKTHSGRRTINLGEGTLQILREHRERQQYQKILAGHRWTEIDLIFSTKIGTPLDPCNLRKDFRQVLEKAGLPMMRFHDLRHTAASLMLNNGVPVIVVSRMLGHSRASITMDVYGHLYNEMQDQAAHLMDELVSPVKVDLSSNFLHESSQAKE